MFQFRRIGASLDYRRERFTMDDAYVRAVMRFFVHLWGKGWIYRASRIVNWCPFHLTSLSDLELAHEDVDDALTYCPLPAGGRRGAHHDRDRPAGDDPRGRRGRRPPRGRAVQGARRPEVVVPWVERRVPVIADERVELDFGTGALKVTPGHDVKDWEIGRDHGLPELTVIGPDGRMNAEAGRARRAHAGGGRRADPRVAARARPAGEAESYRHTVALCDRCKNRIEPLISPQWWCSMEELKKPALAAMRDGRVTFHPESQHRFAVSSLEDAPDWNISRQIWWGHQLPALAVPGRPLDVRGGRSPTRAPSAARAS